MRHHTPYTVSVIVPVRDGQSTLADCLYNLKTMAPGALEIIVVVDGGEDQSHAIAQDFGTKVIRLPRTEGPAKARNTGAGAASGDILLFVDADVTVPRNTIRMITDTFAADPELTAIFGSYDDVPWEPNFLSQFKNLFHHYIHQTANEEASTFWAGCGAVRRAAFFEVSGFDERYAKPSIEDIELGYRLKAAGYRIRLIKSIQVRHLKRWTFISLLKSEILRRAIPWTELIFERRKMMNDLNLKISERISVFLVYGILFSLLLTVNRPLLLWITVLLCAILFSINTQVYSFFAEKRGTTFATKALLWHWFYFLYSGFGFMAGTLLYFGKKRFRGDE